MAKVFNGRMCDVDGCSSQKNLIQYSYKGSDEISEFCEWHQYLAEEDENFTKIEPQAETLYLKVEE